MKNKLLPLLILVVLASSALFIAHAPSIISAATATPTPFKFVTSVLPKLTSTPTPAPNKTGTSLFTNNNPVTVQPFVTVTKTKPGVSIATKMPLGTVAPPLVTSVPPLGSIYGLGLTDRIVNVGNGNDVETTSIAIAPGESANCPKGRVLFASGSRMGTNPKPTPFPMDRPNLDFPILLAQDLDGTNTRTIALPSAGADFNMITFDNNLVRMADGEVLLLWGVGVKRKPVSTAAQEIWNKWKDYNEGWRSAFLIWRSTNCGDSWTNPKLVLDSAEVKVYNPTTSKFELGACGWPQGNDLVKWLGGYDRQEVYVDPWTNWLYVTTMCVGGRDYTKNTENPLKPGHYIWNTVYFASQDKGETWTDGRQISPYSQVPVVMTSLPPNEWHKSGRVFFFRCDAGVPHLTWTHPKIWDAPLDTAKISNEKCEGLRAKDLPGGTLALPDFFDAGLRNAGAISISRVKSDATGDYVRVSFPSIKNGRQVLHVYLVRITHEISVSKTSSTLLLTLDAAEKSARGHILYASFIETDRVKLPKNSAESSAVLYWYETVFAGSSGPNEREGRLTTRFVVVDDNAIQSATEPRGKWSKVSDLALTKGIQRSWDPLYLEFVGDYVRGAFYYANSKLNFVAQWPERSTPSDRMQIHYNIVQVTP